MTQSTQDGVSLHAAQAEVPAFLLEQGAAQLEEGRQRGGGSQPSGQLDQPGHGLRDVGRVQEEHLEGLVSCRDQAESTLVKPRDPGRQCARCADCQDPHRPAGVESVRRLRCARVHGCQLIVRSRDFKCPVRPYVGVFYVVFGAAVRCYYRRVFADTVEKV